VQPFGKGFEQFLQRQKASGETLSFKSYDDLTGRTLGNYRIIRPIGRGGMATVYQGYQPSLDRYVAIKVLAPNLGGDEEFVARFKREASSVGHLRHQNLVQMVDFGVHGELTYMVMEYIAGETLKERMIRAKTDGKKLTLPEISQILRHVAEALDYAHAHAVVHRDVKPANIMIRPEERLAELTGAAPFTAVLTDFGVARMLEGVDFTQTGMTLGTPDYMSPEQVKGESVGPPADIYALGIVLWEMLTGELPFQGDTPMAVLLKRVQERPPSVLMKVPDLPDRVEAVMQQALATEPDDRFRTASEFSRAFDDALGAGD
jgi:serine/threonine protein kinase